MSITGWSQGLRRAPRLGPFNIHIRRHLQRLIKCDSVVACCSCPVLASGISAAAKSVVRRHFGSGQPTIRPGPFSFSRSLNLVLRRAPLARDSFREEGSGGEEEKGDGEISKVDEARARRSQAAQGNRPAMPHTWLYEGEP